MNDLILIKIENYITKLYDENSPAENVYHNLSHIKKVVEVIKEICKYSKIENSDLEILTIAAWFHDVGHIFTWEGHEDVSIKYAKKFLEKNNYPKDKIVNVCNCINATKLGIKPNNLLEEIICDADLSHLGSDDFFERSNLLRKEMEVRKKNVFSELEWVKLNKKFIEEQKFYTDYARKMFDKIKKTNLDKINLLLSKLK